MSNTPTNLAGIIGWGLLMGGTFLGMLFFSFMGIIFHWAFVPACVCLAGLGFAGYRFFQQAK